MRNTEISSVIIAVQKWRGEFMSDLISRQAAIDAVSDACFELRGVFGRCEDVLKALPSAQLERKIGRWEYLDYGGFGNFHCTACGEICICNGDYDFCPNCGAEMLKEGEE